jgi:methylenetetrahydrofolate dehydrogenase (NADP+)/methenyltetrahydrofolate cyclohydrolase
LNLEGSTQESQAKHGSGDPNNSLDSPENFAITDINRPLVQREGGLMLLLDGKQVALALQAPLRDRITKFISTHRRKPGLAVVIVGENPASQVYVRNKVKTTQNLGMESFHFELPQNISELELLKKVRELNADVKVDGILVQLPLPPHLNAEKILAAIDPQKDPDGLTITNLGLLFAGQKRVAPCTPWGVMEILKYYKIPIAGTRACVIGRSNIVGKPMAHLLLEAQATVTICHSKTVDLMRHTRDAEIVVVAAGRERFIGREAFAKDAVVIDVGMHRPTQGSFAGKLCGDVRFEELEGHVRAATPVPGGVGPMTIQILMENTVCLAELRVGG